MNRYRIITALLLLVAALGTVKAQKVDGVVLMNGNPGSEVLIFIDGSQTNAVTDEKGRFTLKINQPFPVTLVAFKQGYQTQSILLQELPIEAVRLEMSQLEKVLEELVVEDATAQMEPIGWLNAISGTGIYAAKKSEVIRPSLLTINKAANVSRQIYASVPGLNIWESDGAGVQLGIGGRGLNPNRTSNFNVRQNGYDISADALGYPESYYTPPIQAIEKIELVRGAASLQYGTQFGGMLNFVFKEGPKDKPIEVESTQTIGSFGLFNSFNSVGGTVGKVSYYGFYQYKRSDGWRPNSDLDLHTGYLSLKYNFSPLASLKIEHTSMSYLAQQPGGMTDNQFEQNPRQSNRTRNWFDIDWNISSLIYDHRFSPRWKINNRTFYLNAHRYAVGNLGRIDRPDNLTERRDLLKDDFHNVGNELRVLHHYRLFGKKSIMVLGNRLYMGNTWRRQGLTDSSDQPVFDFESENPVISSDFDLPSRNISLFMENVVHITDKISITPGIRFEHILTASEGFYFDRLTDLAGNIIREEQVFETQDKRRNLQLLGLGVSYQVKEQVELYANYSQNFRAINFNDIRVVNPSFQVDPGINDERGFNVDLGIRGTSKGGVKYDGSLFWLSYQDRIGAVLRTEPDPQFNFLVDRTYRFRTNIADAGIYGVEFYAERPILKSLFMGKNSSQLKVFVNFAYISARYLNSDENGIAGNRVEMVPPVNLKTGLSFRNGNFGSSLLFGFVDAHFSDATNTDSSPPVPTAVEGIIPSYHYLDLSFDYQFKSWVFETGSNNLTNQFFFTRRAAGYPGPGILPSDGRSFYFSVGFKL
ncbi:MAG: Fe(3+) dicitrate transport protein [Cyclobacteriaceae bacterium]|jgi:Fe(3+) dicitrate transport protein